MTSTPDATGAVTPVATAGESLADAPVATPEAPASSTDGSGASGAPSRIWEFAQDVLLGVLIAYVTFAPVIGQIVGGAAIWAAHWTVLAVSMVSVARFPRRGILPFVLFVALFAAWWATYPVWSSWDRAGYAHSQGRSLLACFITAMGVIGLTGPTRAGLGRLRRMWIFLTALLVSVGAVEVITGRHFVAVGEYLPPAFSPSAFFGNPNNLAPVLLVGVGVIAGRALDRISPIYRVALGVLAGAACVLVGLTLSRLSTACLILVTAAAWLLHRTRTRSGSPGPPSRWARPAVGALLAAGVLSFIVPALRVFNPLARILTSGEAAAVRSDSLRVSLARIAVELWSEHPWLGIGGARFEYLSNQRHRELHRLLPLHNTFLEILTEYGVVVVTPLVLLLVVGVWRATGPMRRVVGIGRPVALDRPGARHMALMFLLGFVVAGVLMSSALIFAPWWIMAASFVVAAWHLGPRPRRSAGLSAGSAGPSSTTAAHEVPPTSGITHGRVAGVSD